MLLDKKKINTPFTAFSFVIFKTFTHRTPTLLGLQSKRKRQ